MTKTVKEYLAETIKNEEIELFLKNGKDFIDDEKIIQQIDAAKNPDPARVREILAKSLDITRLSPEETAILINVKDPDLYAEMQETALKVKLKVYDNRIVTFAPIYCSNLCVNNCLYCGFREDNEHETRRVLSHNEIVREAECLARTGHKRTIAVFGEHPSTSAEYIADAIRGIYSARVQARIGYGNIRRVNVNAAPMSIADYKIINDAGIGTYQVFQETYHHKTYATMHPSGIKANYRWRLYALHRAMAAGIEDTALGALYGLYDWRFEVMASVYHAEDLESHFNGLGPHTVSFPRINPASGALYNGDKVSDDDFLKLITVLRLAIPYAGLIITARESADIRRKSLKLGITQTDASTRIGIGAYSDQSDGQEIDRQQFELGDTRSLDEVIREFAESGLITSFCTAGYRCGRTGDKIMNLLKCGIEGKFCKLNAVLTFREWLDDFASEETRTAGLRVLEKELVEIEKDPFFTERKIFDIFKSYYDKIGEGERDLYL
jgi:2-iminoacetate synthase